MLYYFKEILKQQKIPDKSGDFLLKPTHYQPTGSLIRRFVIILIQLLKAVSADKLA